MITRKEYISGKATFDQYYSQFVTAGVRQVVERRIGLDKIRRSKDPNFNDIPLKQWDDLSIHTWPEQIRLLKEAGDYPSLAHTACVAKSYASTIRGRYPL